MQTELKFISSAHYSSVIVSVIMIFFIYLSLNNAGLISGTWSIFFIIFLLLPALAGIISGRRLSISSGKNYLIEILIPLLSFLLLDYLGYLIRGIEPGLSGKLNNDFLRAGISYRMNNLLASGLLIIFLRLNFSDLKNYILRVSFMITLLLVVNFTGVTYFYTILSTLVIVLTGRAFSLADSNSNKTASYLMIFITSFFLSTTTSGIILALMYALFNWRMYLMRLIVSILTIIGGVLIFKDNLFTDTLSIIPVFSPVILITGSIAIIYLGWITVTREEVYFYSGIISFTLATCAYSFSETSTAIYILSLTSVIPFLIASLSFYKVDRYAGRVMT